MTIITARTGLPDCLFFTRVGTYVQRGSKFCFVVLLGSDTLLKCLHYCPISPCIQRPCPAALPGSLAPAALLGSSLARQQPCPAALPGSLASCSAALPGRLARQFDQFRPDLMRALARSAVIALYCTAVAGHQTACARCCCPDRFKLVFSPISPCFHYLHLNAASQLHYRWQQYSIY
jgi:hypothetical protein